MRSKNVTKSQFLDFLQNNRVFRELAEIKKFTFEDFINGLKEDEDRLDALIEHIGEDPSEMTLDEKINRVLEVAYIDLVNNRMEIFVRMTQHHMDDMIKFAGGLGMLPPHLEDKAKELEKTDKIRQKFLSYVMKYEKNPTKFFEDEIENFQYIANKMIKKISKVYAMAQDDEQQVSESILNWELYQKVKEQKNGKMKFDTEIRKKY
jgi:hypothetical protein